MSLPGVRSVARRNRVWQVLIAVAAFANVLLACSAPFFLFSLVRSSIGVRGGVDVAGAVRSTLWLGGIVAVAGVAMLIGRIHKTTMTSLRARLPAPGEADRLVNIARELSIGLGIPVPAVAVIDDDAPNAIGVGLSPKRTTIAVTTGLLRLAARDEVEAVVAAELVAVARFDTAMRTTVLACTEAALGNGKNDNRAARSSTQQATGVATRLAARVAVALRQHSVDADAGTADAMTVGVTRHPDALRRVLVKLREDPRVVAADPLTAWLWFEPVLVGNDGTPERLAAVHGALDRRIARLGGPAFESTDAPRG